MTTKGRWARVTPYEVGIPGREFAERVFSAIREETRSRELDGDDPGSFVLLGEVGRAIREIQGEERGGEAIQRYGSFLFHAYHFHEAGEPLLLLEEELARHLVEGAFAGVTWGGELPSEAGYVQLPRHLFWSDPGEEETPEPLDGFFWARTARDTLSLLLVMGVREGRPGVSVIEVPPVDLSEAGRRLDDAVRGSGEDFETKLPGGDLNRLYTVATLGEAVKLASRVFAYLVAKPESLGGEERAPTQSGETPGAGTRPSVLPFRRIVLGGAPGDDAVPDDQTRGEQET